MGFKEFKSKKTGLVKLYSEQEYAQIVNNKPDLLKRYIITDITSRPIVPETEIPREIKVKPKKK